MNLPKASLYLFDMDGTILDSMPEWEYLGRNYLQDVGITPPEDLEKTIETMTLEESASYFQTLGLNKERGDIISEVVAYIQDKYRLSIPAKPGMLNLIQHLKMQESTLALLTTSDECCTRSSMERLGILSYFQYIYTSSMLHLGKDTPEIYQKMCSICQTTPEDTVVFEDALYAIRSAREAGCTVIAVADASNEKDWEEISRITNHFWKDKRYYCTTN